MERMNSHRAVVRRLLECHAESARRADSGEVESDLVVSPALDRFVLVETGWAGGRRVNHVHLHVRLKGDKIWIEDDWTETGLATELVAAGVPKEDIVLGFQPPERRHLTEFAVA